MALCVHNSTKQERAVKIFEKKSLLENKRVSKNRQAILNEINIMRQVDHPNIIRLYEIYEGSFHIYLVMDLLKGGELYDSIVKSGYQSERKSFKIIYQLF